MKTIDLINAALAAKTAFEDAEAKLTQVTQQAQAAIAQAKADRESALQALDDANQALHDDLKANGPCAVFDPATNPAAIDLYSFLDPDTYQVTEIRMAA
jgi:hypothetical protein